MTSTRRRGLESSATRAALMDAVEEVMREEGYGALSARRVAARAGLKYQLVFYYFEGMDELLLATYRRRIAAVEARISRALACERPLHALWEAWSDASDAALTMEFMALANHNPAIREETVVFGERVRRMERAALAERIASMPGPAVFTPFAITMAIASVGGLLGLEAGLGISGGHREAQALIDWCLQRLEPGADPT